MSKMTIMSDVQNWDNDLQVDGSRKSQTEMHWQHGVWFNGPWRKLRRVMSLVPLITRHLFLWVKHCLSSFRAKAKGHDVAYFLWFMIRCETNSHRHLPSWLAYAEFSVRGKLAGIQPHCECCVCQCVRRWVADCLLNVLRAFELSEGSIYLCAPNICMFGYFQRGEREKRLKSVWNMGVWRSSRLPKTCKCQIIYSGS